MAPIDVAVVLALHVAQDQQCWAACDVCPRTWATQGGMPCLVSPVVCPACWRAAQPLLSPATRAFERSPRPHFRLGCYKNLPFVFTRIDRDRRAPREERLCQHCTQRALGDEYHVVFEFPATRPACAPFAHLFPPGCTMLQVITHPDHLGVARCILACLYVIDVPVVWWLFLWCLLALPVRAGGFPSFLLHPLLAYSLCIGLFGRQTTLAAPVLAL